MPEPLPLPVRVLVKGASTVCWMSPMDGPRSDFTYPRALEAELLSAGRPATVQAISVPSELTKWTLRNWEHEVLGFSPDVIVLTYGHYETLHLFLPRWLERHANSLKARPGFVRERYRRHVLRPLWMALARLQARLDSGWLGRATSTIRPRRCVEDLRALVDHVSKISSPLVIVFEVLSVAERRKSWFPGMARRVDEFNRRAAEMVASFDSQNVRFFRVSPLVEEHAGGDRNAALPDGFHWTPHMHRVIGRELASEILKWCETQPHLRPAD